MTEFSNQYINTFIILLSLFFSIRCIDGSDYHYRNNEYQILDRNKRNVFPPNMLKIRLNYDNYSEIFEMSQVESDYLVNWDAFEYKYTNEASDKFMQVGKISNFKDLVTFYQSESTHSAVTLFCRTSFGDYCSINGILGEKYALEYKPYVEKKGIADIRINFTEIIPRKVRRKARSIADASKKKIGNSYENPEFYLETLVFIDGSLINEELDGEMKKQSNRQKLYTVQVLSFFNIVNMLFSITNFKINIAGIIFNERYEEGNFLLLNHARSYEPHQYNIPQVIDTFYQTLSTLPSDLKSRDLFDCIIHLTDFSLYDTESGHKTEGILSYPTKGIYEMRKSESFQSYPLIISNSSLNYPSVVNTAHHVFHLLGSANYIKKHNITGNQTTIIRDFDPECDECYEWTEDYCAFINKPRVKSSDPSILVSKNDQCWCYDYSYKYDDTKKISRDICIKGFECELNSKVVLTVPFVLDGTPCDTDKVCWNKTCTQIV